MTHINTTPARRRPWVALIVIACAWMAIAIALGCAPTSDSSTSPEQDDPRGMYQLESINYVTIPSKAYHGPYFDPVTTRFYNQQIVMVNRGSINLLTNGNWAITMDLTITRDGVVTTKAYYADGTYEIVQGIELNDFSKGRIQASVDRLEAERAVVRDLGLI